MTLQPPTVDVEAIRARHPLSEVMAPFERYVASGEINSTVPDQQAVLAPINAAFAAFDRRLEAFCLISRPPVLDRAGMHPDCFSNLGKFVAVHSHAKRYLALLLLLLWAELAGIFFIHSDIMT